jgi:amidophosphoribosyltransferase
MADYRHARNLDDVPHEECGVFGVFGHVDAAALTVLGLHALQHRGSDAAGIVTYDDGNFFAERHTGLVSDVFGGVNATRLANLKGARAIGHNRYSIDGGGTRNIQPMFADTRGGGIALAQNGNLTNARQLREELVSEGRIIQSTSDAELIIQLMARSRHKQVVDRLVDALKQAEGAYSLVALTSKRLIGLRDPWGVRPLVLGRLGSAYVLASETCALDIIDAEFVRDIGPGEMVVIRKEGVEIFHPFGKKPNRFCIFEYVYFSRPDSIIDGRSVYEQRKRTGMELAREAPALADVVMPIPDTSIPAAIGYAAELRLPVEFGLIRNNYVGRTFIEPTNGIRRFRTRLKLNPSRAAFFGKRVVLVDDCVLRGTTSERVVQMVRDAGASEVHLRVASPPTTHSCFYGVHTPNNDELLAHKMDVEQMRQALGTDSLAFISLNGLYSSMGLGVRNEVSPQFCDACFSGDYPIELIDVSPVSERVIVAEFASKFRDRIRSDTLGTFDAAELFKLATSIVPPPRDQ